MKQERELPVWRSLMYVPVNVDKFVDKAHTRGADVIQLDLEDSVPPAQKEHARTLVEKAAARVRRGGADVVVRINQPLSLAVRDLEHSVCPDVDAIVAHVVERVQPGDCVAVFSSGGFGGVHEKLLHRLGDPIMPARPQDMRRVREILERTNLGGRDLGDERAGDVLVVADESGLVGCVAVEIHDEAATLRSLAVVPERRGRGLGWMLADSAVAASQHFREAAQRAVVMRLDLSA